MKILIVDDDPLSLSGIKLALEQRGGHCCTALQDPEAAIEAYRTAPYDAVISDVRMPKMSGIDLLKALKHINTSAVVILMTGFRTPDLVSAMSEYGAHALFFKPIRASELLKTLRELSGTRIC